MRDRPLAAPSDVDAVFLAGAGGKLFFIPFVLRDPTVGFTKLREDPNLLFADWEDPSLCCVLGALADWEDIVSSKFSKYTYLLQYQVYTHSGILNDMFRKDPTLLSPDRELFTLDGNAYPCRCVLDEKINIAEKFEELPVSKSIQVTTGYTDNGNVATLCLHVFRMDDMGNVKEVGAPFIHSIGRTMSEILARVLKTMTFLLPSSILDVGAKGLDGMIDFVFNDGPERTKVFQNMSDKLWQRATTPIRDSELSMGLQVELNEDLELAVKANVESKYLQNGSSSFELEL